MPKNQPFAVDLKRIAEATSPEEIFGALNGTDRTGLVGDGIVIRLANLAIECSAIHEGLMFDALSPSDAIVRKLWDMQQLAVKKLRSGIYGRSHVVTASGQVGTGQMTA